MYDKDSFPAQHFNGVVERAEKLNKQNPELQYHAAWSNECIEFWFLLHFAYYTSNNHRSEYKKFLNEKFQVLGIGKYEKNMANIFELLMEFGSPKLAIRYAKRIIKERQGKTPTEIAPGTKVYMTSMGNSEFVLTIFGALAQEESANTSKRVKFGKKLNAEKGRVPNIVYGYDKTIGDYFNLEINKEESKVVKQIYKWYTEEGYGAAKISNMLNEKGYRTKRNCKWSQNAICRILTNEIYTGKIINGKQEISDFLTGQRREKDETEWLVVERPELRIIEDEVFEKAQEILRGRNDAFNLNHERQSNKYLFSTLIKCKECGWSFRRTVRTYKNTYVRWVCSGRNGKGADSCPNKTAVDEEELIQVLQEYFNRVLQQKNKVIDYVVKEFQRVYKAKDENAEYEKELNLQIARLQRMRQKYMDMYTDDLISREELNDKLGGTRQELDRLENELKMVSSNLTKGDQMEKILNDTFKQIEDITDVHEMTNVQLKRLIKKIEVDKDGNVDIYLRLLGDLGLNESILVEDECENKTALNSNDQT